jgi:hypothetical protein
VHVCLEETKDAGSRSLTHRHRVRR